MFVHVARNEWRTLFNGIRKAAKLIDIDPNHLPTKRDRRAHRRLDRCP